MKAAALSKIFQYLVFSHTSKRLFFTEGQRIQHGDE